MFDVSQDAKISNKNLRARYFNQYFKELIYYLATI